MPEPNQEEKKPRRRIKKKKGHGGHHGGAWKVAYADFVTAMMALFLVLWLVSQADTKLKEAIASYFRSPGVFDTMKGGILSQAKKVSKEPTSLTSKDDEQTLFSVAQSLEKKFSTRPEFSKYKDQIKIDVTDEGLKIQIIDKAEQVSFASGSSDLNPASKSILNEIASGLCELPNKINIGGHTDGRVFTSDVNYSNWELSTDRANAARRVLQAACVKPEQINRVIGFADTDPLVLDDPYAPANRRISITVLKLSVSKEENKTSDEASSPEKTDQKDESENPVKPEKIEKSDKTVKPEKSVSAAEQSKDPSLKDQKEAPGGAEKKLTEKKLQNEGAIKVGEPDIVPDRPKVKQ